VAKESDGESVELSREVSHNLRTPLAVIKGCTDMLLSHPDEELDAARRRELLTMTSENVDRLAEAVEWVESQLAELAPDKVIELGSQDSPNKASPPAREPDPSA
jgi:signal transduction histidine kinase